MTLQGSQWEVVWPRGPVWDPDTQRKPQGKQPASTVVLGDNQESAQRCLPKTFYYSPTQNILGRNAGTNLDSLLKSRDLTLLTKFRLVKITVFPVVMYECENWIIKKAEHWRIDAFELWCWRRLLRVPWNARRSNQSILKEISPEYSLEGLMMKLKLQYFGQQMKRTDWRKPWCWERLKAGGEGDDRGWDHWMASQTQWTWVWGNSWR